MTAIRMNDDRRIAVVVRMPLEGTVHKVQEHPAKMIFPHARKRQADPIAVADQSIDFCLAGLRDFHLAFCPLCRWRQGQERRDDVLREFGRFALFERYDPLPLNPIDDGWWHDRLSCLAVAQGGTPCLHA